MFGTGIQKLGLKYLKIIYNKIYRNKVDIVKCIYLVLLLKGCYAKHYRTI